MNEKREPYGIATAHATGRNYLSYLANDALASPETLEERQRMDKQELRKRWQQVVDKANLPNSRSSPKPHLRDLVAVMEQALQLPPPDSAPGGTCGISMVFRSSVF